ncbi:MAG: phosphodiester glycosidase family protein [Anaerolineae bacterium]|nr:phosphodiester glycosidase family protein [Anaerolineae bacterium]
MIDSNRKSRFTKPAVYIIAAVLVIVALEFGVTFLFPSSTTSGAASSVQEDAAVAVANSVAEATPLVESKQPAVPLPTATPTTTPSPTDTPTVTATPTHTPTPTVSPTPTVDLAECSILGCSGDTVPPTIPYRDQMLLLDHPPQRTDCPDCPANEEMTEAEIDQLLAVDDDTLAQLKKIVSSQQPYEIAPGIVYTVFENVHHVVVDLKASGFTLRNIIPPIPDLETQETIRITPSFCMRPESLVITDADYHGLVGSNKTEMGRELFFHLGRAALFLRPTSFNENRYSIDVMTDYKDFEKAIVSWGAGPLFIFNGRYDFNPKEEWFDQDRLDRYTETTLPKMTVAISRDRKYLFLSISTGLTLEEHAANILALGERWGIIISRAMRFDGNESTYMAIRMGDYMVPVLDIKEPLIVNCLAIEKTD